jgi:hypothetical protein
MRLLAVLAFCLPLTATLVPMPNLAKSVETADAIVVAKLVSGTSFAPGDEMSSDFLLRVDRVLKGNVIAGTEVPTTLEGRALWRRADLKPDPIPPIYGIWFLISTPHGYAVRSRLQYSEIGVGDPLLAPVFLPEQAPAAEPSGSPEVSVANEIASGLRWLAEHNLKNEFQALTENFRSLSQTTTLPVYRQFATEQSPLLRAAGITGLIAANDPEGVKSAAADWTDLIAVWPYAAGSLMSYTNPDPAGVRALGSPALREHASYALRAIHTKETLPALAALLDSKSSEIQSQAISGFCLFVRNAPAITPQSVPSMAWLQTRQPNPYLTPEVEHYCHPGGQVYASGDASAYVNFWKSWWTTHQSELEQP